MAESLSSKHTPKVSIVSISYNQEAYIAQALQSFVEQKADFDFEVVIADDCSTDKTAEIIAGYAKQYPAIVKPILRKKNVGVQTNLIDALRHAKGDYIALCEGDDFWTDTSKLQRQVDFLDSNRDYSVVFHPVRVFFEKQEEEDTVYPAAGDRNGLNLTGLLKRNFIQTNSVMYRKKNYDSMPLDILPLDWYLHLYHAQDGKIGFINRVMSSYRRHEGGVWWNSDRDATALWVRHGVSHFRLYNEILKLYGDSPKYEAIIRRHIYQLFMNVLKLDNSNGKPILEHISQYYPDTTALFLKEYYDTTTAIRAEDERQKDTLSQEIAGLHTLRVTLAEELDAIRNSKLWQLRKPIIGLKKATHRIKRIVKK